MALPAALSSLTTRVAIQDTLSRCVTGLDTADSSLFESAFYPDAILDLNGHVMEGYNTIKSDCYDGISKLDTTHIVTNVRVAVDENGTTASMTATAMAQHYRENEGMKPGAPSLLAGSLYTLEVAKDAGDELWKIKYWKLKLVWTQGDMAVITG